MGVQDIDATRTAQQRIILFSTDNGMKIINYRQFFLKRIIQQLRKHVIYSGKWLLV